MFLVRQSLGDPSLLIPDIDKGVIDNALSEHRPGTHMWARRFGLGSKDSMWFYAESMVMGRVRKSDPVAPEQYVSEYHPRSSCRPRSDIGPSTVPALKRLFASGNANLFPHLYDMRSSPSI